MQNNPVPYRKLKKAHLQTACKGNSTGNRLSANLDGQGKMLPGAGHFNEKHLLSSTLENKWDTHRKGLNTECHMEKSDMLVRMFVRNITKLLNAIPPLDLDIY